MKIRNMTLKSAAWVINACPRKGVSQMSQNSWNTLYYKVISPKLTIVAGVPLMQPNDTYYTAISPKNDISCSGTPGAS